MENELLNYIRSTFNYKVDIDAYNFQDKAKLQLLEYKTYKVYFNPINTPVFKDKQDEYIELTMKAFDVWSDAIHNKITFQQVEKEYESDIKVFFLATSATKLGKQYQERVVSGCCNGVISYMKGKLCIAIGIRNYKNDKIEYDKVYHVILHEIGHILCLGHSSNKDDVMSKTAHKYITELSENDIFVLRLIYAIGSGKSYEDEKKYIEECITRLEKFRSEKWITGENIPLISKKNKRSEQKNLLNDLTSIGELKKYKMTLNNLEIKTKQDL